MILNIALLPGDGIGPEVIDQAVKVSNSIAKKFNHKINWASGLIGAAAIDMYGDPYPDITHKTCLNTDAILLAQLEIQNTIMIHLRGLDQSRVY